jgi:hypothetical protein
MASLELSVGGMAVNDARTRESLDVSTWLLGQLGSFTTLMARRQTARTAGQLRRRGSQLAECPPGGQDGRPCDPTEDRVGATRRRPSATADRRAGR